MFLNLHIHKSTHQLEHEKVAFYYYNILQFFLFAIDIENYITIV